MHTTKTRADELIALLLGDGVPSPRTRHWLGTVEGRREIGAYRRTLRALDRLGMVTAGAAKRTAGGRARFATHPVYYTALNTPIGRVFAASSGYGLVRVSFRRAEPAFVAELRRRLSSDVIKSDARMAGVVTQLRQYFAGRRPRVDVPVDLRALTPFQRRVLCATRRVPPGRVVSYGEIARRIGTPKASRAVGQALGHNPVPIVIPCHRIVAGGGTLGGYTGGLAIKKRLLAIEGLRVA